MEKRKRVTAVYGPARTGKSDYIYFKFIEKMVGNRPSGSTISIETSFEPIYPKVLYEDRYHEPNFVTFFSSYLDAINKMLHPEYHCESYEIFLKRLGWRKDSYKRIKSPEVGQRYQRFLISILEVVHDIYEEGKDSEIVIFYNPESLLDERGQSSFVHLVGEIIRNTKMDVVVETTSSFVVSGFISPENQKSFSNDDVHLTMLNQVLNDENGVDILDAL
jgi:hypothetical protein